MSIYTVLCRRKIRCPTLLSLHSTCQPLICTCTPMHPPCACTPLVSMSDPRSDAQETLHRLANETGFRLHINDAVRIWLADDEY
ncbi:hypothetical protein BDU57DRAFT_508323 [Ampelomyces quisqualis]|uniref:Uncharacterized protein n=1 Tax=Ampelomyces quisqualis TaxID=50730 RepID=A0A6A5R237_AMPQU|nr:hypothetical protein BDU57DRAFT_508323 [Ampelomyces quisqualis]